MEPARLDYERSIALHAEVARRLLADPAILDRARARLELWVEHGGRSVPLLVRWREVLDRPVAQVAAFLTERSEQAAWLRSASPFAGVLDPQTRRTILRDVRRRLETAA